MKPEPSPMTDQTRREFLAAAGALASTSFALSEAIAGDTTPDDEPGLVPAAIPPHRPLAVDGIHVYTNSWRAYAATPFSPTWRGIKKSIGNNGFTKSAGSPPAFCFYRPHHAGPGTYQIGFKMPWAVVGPYTLMGPEEWDYSHLCRQDRFTQVWLETQDYDYDVLSDTDLHLDPRVLDCYKVLFVVGHSEYWSFEAMGAVSRFMDRGGNAVVLSGNTAFWRVSFNADASVIGITLLAQGFADARKIAFAWDYFQRPVPLAKNPAISVAAEMIYWERPDGGRVFHAGSINAGSTLAADPKWSGLLQNVLSHFGVERA